MTQQSFTQLPMLTKVFEVLRNFADESDLTSDLEYVVESKELTRDTFFNEACWAILVSGVSRNVASKIWNNAKQLKFPLGSGEWEILAEWSIDEFNGWCKILAQSLKKPRPDLVGIFREKWRAIWDLAMWLAEFEDDQEFQDQVFGGKSQGEQLDDEDIKRLAQIKKEQNRLFGIGHANRFFILRNLGGDFLKPDVWVLQFCAWLGGVSVSDLADSLRDEGIHCGTFDAYLWTYCESMIRESRHLNAHFDELFLSDRVIESFVTIKEFEEQVWNIEGIRIVVRVIDTTRSRIEPYEYIRRAARNWRVTTWLSHRITRYVGTEQEVVVLMGNGGIAHGRTLLQTVRGSYSS